MQLSDCRLVVTGASGGIGQALVETLCANGAQLLLVGRHAHDLDLLASRFPGKTSVVVADIAERQGRDAVLAAARNFGGINGLINAAGQNRFSMLAQHDEEAIAALINLNVTATIQLSQRLLPLLQQQGSALLVNIGSTFGSIGYPGFAAYCASKFALRGFSEALRRELADTEVNVLYVAPRATRTSMNSSAAMALNAALKANVDEPESVAREVMRAVQQNLNELYLGWPEKLFVRINGMLPSVVDRALRKQLPIIRSFTHSQEIPPQ